MLHSRCILAAVVLATHFVTAQAQTPADRRVRLNQIQVIGTHNSYHAGIARDEATLWQKKSPEEYQKLDYQHPPLPQQLDNGIRQIELDVFADAQDGRYAHPSGPAMVKEAGLPPDPDFDPSEVMFKPGFKVMHIQDIDYRSSCQPFIACLDQVCKWSQAHPGHVPSFILVETKQDVPEGLQLT